jgi:capsular exopolysaccharide synthesis family protein
VDTDAAGYSAASLTSGLLVEFVPDTHGVTFALNGTDAASLPLAVNTYAAKYKEYSEDTSAQRFRNQEAELETNLNAARDALVLCEHALEDHQQAHGEVNFTVRQNPWAEERQRLSGGVSSATEEEYRITSLRDSIERDLSHLGVAIERGGGDFRLKLGPEYSGQETLFQLLADDGVIAALEPVQRSLDVRQWQSALRTARDRDAALEAEATEQSRERKALRRRIDELRDRVGSAVGYALVRELRSIASRTKYFSQQKEQLAAARKQEEKINQIFAQHANLESERVRAERAVTAATQKLELLRGTYVEDIGAETAGRGPSWQIRIIEPATAQNLEQVAPKKPLIIALTAFSALAVGLGLVFLVEFLDDTIKSREDFDRYIGLPFLGFIPHISSKEVENPDRAADARPGSAIAEAFRTLRTSILFSRTDKSVHSVLVTSAGPGEGKTTVAVNLAATLAKHKAPVLLIDCDLRKPRVAKALGIPNVIGLTNYLIGEMTLEEVVQETGMEGLYVIPSGPIPPNPAELLHREPMRQLLEDTKELYDKVVIDSPPVIAVTDARVLASWTDGLYLVVSMGKTSRRLIQRAVESITSIGFAVHGAILNNLSMPTGRYGYYYYRDYAYRSGYYREPKDEPKEEPSAKK